MSDTDGLLAAIAAQVSDVHDALVMINDTLKMLAVVALNTSTKNHYAKEQDVVDDLCDFYRLADKV